jgi:hypothetical protein
MIHATLEEKLVTVVIVNWNGKHLICRSLDALRRQRFKQFDTIVVDNGSTDGSVEMIEGDYPEIKICRLDYNTGFCIANNKVIHDVNTRYVVLLNNDAVLCDSWLEQMVRCLEADPETAFAAGKMVFADRPGIIDRAGDGYSWAGVGVLRGRGLPSQLLSRPEKVFGACAAAALYRTEMIRHLGGFDEDFFLLHEDVDLSFRAQLAGYSCIYLPDALVFHGASSSIGKNSDLSVYYGHRNLEWVWLKNMPAMLLIFLAPLHLLYDLGAFLYFAAHGKSRVFLRAKRDAFRSAKNFWNKRKQVQKEKTVSSAYLFSLFDKELFLTRFLHRSHVFRKP